MNKENRIPPGYKYATCLCPDGQKRDFIVPDTFNEASPVLEQGSIKGICGYADERDAWELLFSISCALSSLSREGMAHACISTDCVYIWNNNMMLLEGGDLVCKEGEEWNSRKTDVAFISPQQVKLGHVTIQDDIWSLGATVFHLLMGVKIFNGQGGKVQHTSTPIPSFNESRYSSELCRLIRECLSYNPESRPSLEQVITISEDGLMKSRAKVGEKRTKGRRDEVSLDGITYWPEKIDA